METGVPVVSLIEIYLKVDLGTFNEGDRGERNCGGGGGGGGVGERGFPD